MMKLPYLEYEIERVEKDLAEGRTSLCHIERLAEFKEIKKALTLGGVSYCTTCKENRVNEFNERVEELKQEYRDVLD